MNVVRLVRIDGGGKDVMANKQVADNLLVTGMKRGLFAHGRPTAYMTFKPMMIPGWYGNNSGA